MEKVNNETLGGKVLLLTELEHVRIVVAETPGVERSERAGALEYRQTIPWAHEYLDESVSKVRTDPSRWSSKLLL